MGHELYSFIVSFVEELANSFKNHSFKNETKHLLVKIKNKHYNE